MNVDLKYAIDQLKPILERPGRPDVPDRVQRALDALERIAGEEEPKPMEPHQEATEENVIAELMYDWDEDDEGIRYKTATLMTEDEAKALLAKHRDIYETGKRLGSYAFYIANEIATKED